MNAINVTVESKGDIDVNELCSMLENRPDIPEGECQDVRVTHEHHPPGALMTLSSMRNAVFMGENPAIATMEDGYKEHVLSYDGGVWMRSCPQEIWQMREVLRQAHGNVLIGGLGLGIVSQLALRLSEAEQVITIEKDARVMSLVAEHVDEHDIYELDISDAIENVKQGEIDFAFLDTWQSTGEICFWSEVVPLRRKCRGKLERDDVLCWNESEMLGQILMHSHIHVDLPNELNHGAFNKTLRAAALQQGVRTEQYTVDDIRSGDVDFNELRVTNHQDSDVCALVDRLCLPGTDEWEEEFGELWDEVLEEMTVRSSS